MFVIDLIGNIGGDAEIKTDGGRRYVQFSVADTRRFTKADGTSEEVTNWVSCFYQNPDAEVVKYLKRGTRVYVRGNGEIRLFSSAKDRRMKAGASINVREIQLVGGSSDAVPAELYLPSGEVVKVGKFYAIDLRSFGNKPTVLYDRRGNPYDVDKNGFIMIPAQVSQDAQSDQGAQSDQDAQSSPAVQPSQVAQPCQVAPSSEDSQVPEIF